MEISSLPFSEEHYSTLFSFPQDSNPLSTISFSTNRAKAEDTYQMDYSVDEILNKFLSSDTFDDDNNLVENNDSNDSNSSFMFDQNITNEITWSTEPYCYPTSDNIYISDLTTNAPGLTYSNSTKRTRSEFDNEETSNVANGQRRVWVKDRSKAWWEQVNSPDFPDSEFKKAFRMSKATFEMICNELESVVTKKNTMLRKAIPVRQRVAVCVWRLATGEALREVSKRFGLGISTCHKLVLEVCTAIKDVLMPKFLNWPDECRMREIKREFENFSKIPNVGGSMYTTHVQIIQPKENAQAYFNKKHTERNQKPSYSVTVQGVIDHTGLFTDICIGYPGSMTDEQVLEKSALFQRAKTGILNDVWVVGNSSFPLMDWVLVPYPQQQQTWAQHAYNEKVEEVNGIAKEAFMKLKARWRCLMKRTEMKLMDLPVVLGACCVLHNVCERMGEGVSNELRFEMFDDEVVPENTVKSVDAASVRDKIAKNILHQT